jgi:hypothetical protein
LNDPAFTLPPTAGYYQLRRKKARDRGDCGACFKIPAAPGATKCEGCRDKQRSSQAVYDSKRSASRLSARVISARFCIECQAAGFHRVGCADRPVAA